MKRTRLRALHLFQPTKMSFTDGAGSSSETVPGAPNSDRVPVTSTPPTNQISHEEAIATLSTARSEIFLEKVEANPVQEAAIPSEESEGAAYTSTVHESTFALQTFVPGTTRIFSSSSGDTLNSSVSASTENGDHNSIPAEVDSTIGIDDDRASDPATLNRALPRSFISPLTGRRAIEVTNMDEWPPIAGELVEDLARLPAPPLTRLALQLNSQATGRAAPTSTAASTLDSSNASNPSATRQANSMVSNVNSDDLRDPNNGPDRFQPLAIVDAWNSYQHMTFEEETVGHDRVVTIDGSYISFNSHIENVARYFQPLRTRPILNPGGVSGGHYTIVRIQKPRVGPAFDATAFQEHQPTTLMRSTVVDQFVRDTEFGLWHLTPRTMHPPPPRADSQTLLPQKIAVALRNCHDEFQLPLELFFLSKVIDIANLEYEGDCNINLECGICRMPLVEPRTTECEHTFCVECLSRALNERFECPRCRTPLGHATMESPKLVINMLNEMKVHCPLRGRGCQQTVSRSDVADHVMRHCGYLLVACPSTHHRDIYSRLPRCTILLPRKDLHGNTCRHKMVDCKHCAVFSCPEIDMADHVKTKCPEYMIMCTDCSAIFPRKTFDDHVTQCAEAAKACKASAYGCDFLGAADARKEHEVGCTLAKLMPWLKEQEAATRKLEEARRALMNTNERHEVRIKRLESILNEYEL